MEEKASYRDYTDNASVQKVYSDYQEQFRENTPESEKILIMLVKEISESLSSQGRTPSLVDLGCSTGNFLRRLRQQIPNMELYGIDLAVNVVEAVKADPTLKGIAFERQDMLDLKFDRRFDIVTCNKALPFFPEGQFDKVIANIAGILAPGGSLVIFDWFHRFEQDLEIIDRCSIHPYGWRLFVRSYGFVERYLKKHGFNQIEFTPFEMPIDIPPRDDPADVNTYTVRTETGKRMQFRGVMYQPWCFTVARLR